MYSLIFIMAVFGHFKSGTIQHASMKGVPAAGFLVPASGVLALLGGLLIAFGYKARIGAWMVIIFLLPVTVTMHAFWSETDPQAIQMQMTNFMKNTALIGAALLISWFGAGPLSLDELAQKKISNNKYEEQAR
jgi:putative oxidoreductase